MRVYGADRGYRLFTRQALRANWKSVRPYVVFAVILFFASVVVGGASQGPVDWLDQMFANIQSLSDKAASSDNPEQALFTTILLNNVRSSLLSLYMGIIGGIMPIVTLIVNGMMMGYLFGHIADAGHNVWPLIAKGILPHGVLEIPAFLLACAYGVRLGFSLVRGFFRALIGKTEPWGGFVLALKDTVPGAILIVVLLLAAAVVESTITYWLMTP